MQSELVVAIDNYKKEISKLEDEEKQPIKSVYDGGGEVKFQTIRVNNQAKITELRRALHAAEDKLEELRKNQENKKTHPEIKDDTEKKQKDIERLQHFDMVKKLYEGKSLNKRFLNKINGRSPNWDKISKYSLKELEFLEFIYYGSTTYQQNEIESIKKREEAKGSTATEINKKLREKNFDSFTNALSNPYILQGAIECDEALNRSKRK